MAVLEFISSPPYFLDKLSDFKLYKRMNPIVASLKSHIGHEFTESPSPFTAWLKPVLLAVEEGKMSFQFTIRHDMTNPFGGLHGGVAAAILDDVIGATMYTLNDHATYATVNNVIDYFAVVREGDTIIVETEIIKKGNFINNAQCEIWNADKTKLIVRGYSNMFRKAL